jgi:hypothetical protein
MKKTMKVKVSVLLMAMLLVCSMVLGNATATAKSKYVGTTWALTSGETQGIEVPTDSLGIKMKMEFVSSSKVKLTVDKDSAKVKYKVSKDTITIFDGDQKMVFHIKGNKLILKQDDVNLIFTKQTKKK